MTLPLFNIGGLVSGLDTNSIIAQLIEVERIPITNLETRRTGYEAKDAAWQTVATRLSALDTALGAIDSSADFAKFAVATSSNEDAVAVTVSGAPDPGSTSFTVSRLAANHQLSAGSYTSPDAAVGAGDLTITVGGVDHVVSSTAGTTLADLAELVDGLGVGVSASVVALGPNDHTLLLTADESGAAAAFTASATQPGLGSFGVVQQGQDAELTVGSGPGALTITRATNEITDLVAGATIDLRQTTPGPVTVTVSRDVDAAVTAVSAFVDELNAAVSTLADFGRYDPEAQVGGPLVGDGTARSLLFGLRHSVSGTVLGGAYPYAGSIGISLDRTGSFTFDAAKLRTALEDDWNGVADLFAAGATAADSRLSFVAAAPETVPGSYEVVVTQAAAAAAVDGSKYKKPGAETTFQIVVDGATVDVTVAKRAEIDEAIQAINDALTTAGVTVLTAAETTLASGDPAIRLEDSRYGSAYGFQVIGDPFGLAGTHAGADVAGTIGGEAATGSGRTLTADTGDPAGLVVDVSASAAEVAAAGGSLSLGDVVFASGLGGAVEAVLDRAQGAGGSIARARDMWKAQIDLIDDRIAAYEDRLDRREALLLRQFAGLETAMASLMSQASWLSAQLPGLGGGA